MNDRPRTSAKTSGTPAPKPGETTAKGDAAPAAGPHAKPELTDEEKTPGAGTLPDTDEGAVGDGASS